MGLNPYMGLGKKTMTNSVIGGANSVIGDTNNLLVSEVQWGSGWY